MANYYHFRINDTQFILFKEVIKETLNVKSIPVKFENEKVGNIFMVSQYLIQNQ